MGEIWTVKGRERERVTAAERAVVTPQRRKLPAKSMHGPPTIRVAFPDLVGLMPIGRIFAAYRARRAERGTLPPFLRAASAFRSAASTASNCGDLLLAPLTRKLLMARNSFRTVFAVAGQDTLP
jgi:hypothetical protein